MEDNKKGFSSLTIGSYRWIIYAALVLILVLVLAWFTLEKIERQIKKDSATRLTSILDSTYESIEIWFEERAHEITYTARLSDFKSLVKELLSEKKSTSKSKVNPSLKRLREYITLSTEGHKDHGFFVISPDFINIASHYDSNLGEKNLLAGQGDYLERIFNSETVLTMPVRSKIELPGADGKLAIGQPTMFIGVPVKDNGKVIAALLVRIDPSQRFTRIIQRFRPGESGDIYAFDSAGTFISEPRFSDQLREIGLIKTEQSAILNLKVRDPGGDLMKGFVPDVPRSELPLTFMAEEATRGIAGINLDGYRDYRGVVVAGAWRWYGEFDFGQTVEVDVAEIYASLNFIRRAVGIVIGLIMILFSGFIVLVISRNRRLDIVITESKRVEEELRRYHDIVDQSGDSLFILDAESAAILDVNEATCTALGFSRASLLEMRMLEITSYINNMGKWKECVSKLSRTDGMFIETEHLSMDGTYIPVEVRVKLVSQDEKSYVVIFARDITERKEADAELRKLKIAVEQSPAAVIITDKTGKIEYANNKFCDITGYSTREVIGKNSRILKSGTQSNEFYREMWETIISGHEWRGDFHNKKKDGTFFWESTVIAPIKDEQGSITHFIAIKEDITERREAEESFRTLSLVVNQSPAATIIIDTELCINYVNPAFVENMGYSADELIGENIKMLYSANEHSAEFFEAIWSTASTGKTWRGDICNRRRDGTTIWELITISPVIGPQGKITHFVYVKVDDTERKNAEEALRISEAQQRLILNSTAEAIYGLDLKGKCTFANKACVKILGYDSVEDLIGRNMHDLIHHTRKDGSAFPAKECRIYKAFQVGKDTHADDEILWKKDKKSFDAEYWSHPIIKDDELVGSVVTFLDITNRRVLESELIKAQKLESIGLLAGGIAHDFNNMLTSIVGNVDFAKQLCEPGEKIFERLEKVQKASSQATALTQQLLTFSKGGGDPVMRVISIVDIVNESLDISLRGSQIIGEFSAPGDLYLINADSGQISQVLNNLIINAAQAMPDGGKVKIKCKNMHIESSHKPVLSHGNYVKISVKDSGSGIKEKDLKRIFDPYFTTKDSGTGLGLATTYSIIHNHGGMINVSSTVGKGTVFDIYLPAIDSKSEGEGTGTEELLKGDGRILIMDDDHEIGEFISTALEACGYKSRLVFTGEAALEEYQSALDLAMPYDAVIMDLVIKGGMGAKEAIVKFKEIDPAVVGIVSSGYSTDPVMVRYGDFGFKGVLAKPYKASELSRVIKEVLDKA